MPKKVDANQPEIVKALRKIGASVACVHEIGHGFVDLLVGFRGANTMLEVKIPKGKLTPDEVRFHESWRGKIYIVHSVEEALKAIGAI